MLVMTDVETGMSDTTMKLYSCHNPSISNGTPNQFGIQCQNAPIGITPGPVNLNIEENIPPDVETY